MDKQKRIRELVEILNKAGRTYYQEDREIMSNLEYDGLYDELLELEKETGIVLADSPSVNVGYEAVTELPKENHEVPMLSLDKTKDVGVLAEFLGSQRGLLSWKLDGLTIVLTYRDGTLYKAVTRGNGQIGEVITNNARVFKNIPLSIPFKGELILRGEAVIKYSDFNRINEKIDDVGARFKNPRNLCSGSVRQLNNQITAERNVNFYAFYLVRAEGEGFHNSCMEQFEWMKRQGFSVVEYKEVTAETLPDTVSAFASSILEHDIPSDGLVLLIDDISYGQSLGATAKFPRNSMALKWVDELRTTRLKHIEWSPSRTGLINPIAVFEPVELEGTTVTRASLHNISILEALALGEGDEIEVYKANMIIPQVAENLTRSGSVRIPRECPACGHETVIRETGEVRTLYCPNEDCPAKMIKSLAHFVSRNAMNIEGISEETLDKFLEKGFIKEYADLFRIERYEDEIVEMKGFGRKSYDNLVSSLEKARKTTLPRFIYSLGIPNIGLANAKMICREFGDDLDRLRKATREELMLVEGVGEVIADTFASWFEDPENIRMVDELLDVIEITQDKSTGTALLLENKTFVITGSLNHFENRDEARDKIESMGGKVTGSVTKNTDYLINNDTQSQSSKNKKAKELGIPIISEKDFLAMIDAAEEVDESK
ncbi:NAD-dependent DNA ligase LigA [Parasporobacterium paucivorans]|nr:NAD-dependent DNA ligase LigA [Parasporobacterium paucivorans]